MLNKQYMIVSVNNKPVVFSKLPPLEPYMGNEFMLYKLTDEQGTSILRKVCNSTIISDLYAVIDLFMPDAQTLTYTQDLTETEIAIAKNMAITKKHKPTGQPANAWCYYDLNAPNQKLIALYPDKFICAKIFNITPSAALMCSLGNLAAIKAHIVLTRYYASDEELQIRRKQSLHRGRTDTHVYVYDYNGNPVGVFNSVTETAAILNIKRAIIRQCLITQDKLKNGYYFYNNPNSRPPIKIDTTL